MNLWAMGYATDMATSEHHEKIRAAEAFRAGRSFDRQPSRSRLTFWLIRTRSNGSQPATEGSVLPLPLVGPSSCLPTTQGG